MPRSRSVSPRGSSDSFHLASTCERSSSAHRAKHCAHQRTLVTNSASCSAFASSGPHRKKDKDKDKDRDAEGDDARKDNKCALQESCPQDDNTAAKNDPCASVSSEKKTNLPCKVIPVSLPPLMCDINDRPTVHQRRAEQAEVRARLARENEESFTQERERGGYNSGSQTPGYGPQKGGSNCPAGSYGAQTASGSALASETDCCSSARSQRPQSAAGGPGAYGQAGYGQAGYGQGGGYGSKGPGGVSRGNCPPVGYGPLTAQVPGCPPVDGVCAGGYGSQTSQPYGNIGEAQLGYHMEGRYGEPYPPTGGQIIGQSRAQPSPFGPPQGPNICSPLAAPQLGGAPGGTPGGAPVGGGGRGGTGPQDDDSLQVNCICTVSQSDCEAQGCQYESGQGAFRRGGPFQQGNEYGSGGAMAGSKDGLDGCGTCASKEGNPPTGCPATPQGGQAGRPSLVQQGSQKGQLRSQQGGQRNVQPRDQGATQLILQIDAGRMLLRQQSGPICIPCTLMPVGQFEGGPDDESMRTAQDNDVSGSSVVNHQQCSQSKGAGQQTGGPVAHGVSKRPSTQEPRAFRPAPKAGPGGFGTQRFGGQPPVQQNICNQAAADFSIQTGSQRQPSAMEGSPQVGFGFSPPGAFCPPQGADFSQGPGPHGRSPALGAYKEGQDGICVPQNTHHGQGMGLSPQPAQAPGGGLCHLPGGPPQGVGQSPGYIHGPGGFQGKNAPQDPYQSDQKSYPGQQSGPSGGFCPPGIETGQGNQQGKVPGAQAMPSSGQGSLPPGEHSCRSQCGIQQKMGQGQQRGPHLDSRPGNVSFESGSQDQCFIHQGSEQYPQNAGGFGGYPPNDSQQTSALATCVQRCCNATAFNSGRFGHEDSPRGRHRIISATGAPDCGAEGVGARHGRQRRSNGHPKGPIDEDDASCSRDKNAKEKEPSTGIEMATPCAYPMCVIPWQPPCCVMPCQAQTCCWPPPTCMCCMPKCCPGSVSNSRNGAPNAANGSCGGSGSSDNTSYGGCRPCCMRYGGNNHRRACRHTISRHSTPQLKEKST